MENQEPQNLFSCSMCFFQCNINDELIRHYIRYHKYDPQFRIQCNFQRCGATYHKWKSFKQHVKRNHFINITPMLDNFDEENQSLLREEQNDIINQDNPNEQNNNLGKVL